MILDGGAAEKMDESSVAGGTSEDVTMTDVSDKSSGPKDLPFQVQICYTDLEGARAMRVLTQTKPVTTEREQAETCMWWFLFQQ